MYVLSRLVFSRDRVRKTKSKNFSCKARYKGPPLERIVQNKRDIPRTKEDRHVQTRHVKSSFVNLHWKTKKKQIALKHFLNQIVRMKCNWINTTTVSHWNYEWQNSLRLNVIPCKWSQLMCTQQYSLFDNSWTSMFVFHDLLNLIVSLTWQAIIAKMWLIWLHRNTNLRHYLLTNNPIGFEWRSIFENKSSHRSTRYVLILTKVST